MITHLVSSPCLFTAMRPKGAMQPLSKNMTISEKTQDGCNGFTLENYTRCPSVHRSKKAVVKVYVLNRKKIIDVEFSPLILKNLRWINVGRT